MGFWRTLILVCTDTGFFLRLNGCYIGKALLQLTVLILLLSLFSSCGYSCTMSPQIRSACARLFQETGDFRFLPDRGIRTTRNPDVKQSFLLDDHLRFDYRPGGTLTEAEVQSWNTSFGLIVMDRGLMFWTRGGEPDDRSFSAVPLQLEVAPEKTGTLRTNLSASELYEILKRNFERRPDQKIHFLLATASEKTVADNVCMGFAVMVFFASLFAMAFLALGSVLFFSVMQFFWFAALPRRPSFRAILQILIYLTFPSLCIAVLYSLVMIPQLSPQTVYFAAYFLYYILIFRRIRRELNPPEPDADNDDL
ncbi:MAG: hypothetical protein J5806_05155 [Lentisphaeria bacterium]|nr:hypothetical protein [Lentisphaeria bacterium]